MTRRAFLSTSATAGAGAALGCSALGSPAAQASESLPPSPAPGRPVSIASGNGLRATARAVELLQSGEDTLDAVIAGVTIVEDDPEDMTVGYGGLPNEEGVVELDACVMHGPSCNAGAVAALQKIRNPSRVAQLVMSRTDHVLLAGEGALRFAVAHGFEPQDLLTDKARRAWLRWKETHSAADDWLSEEEARAALDARPTGTINCLAVDAKGDLSGVTTTSGLAYKIPGRVGDSPIIGAGLYVDNDVGAAGATGRGEAVIISSGSRIVCENMRRGMPPAEAVLDVLERIARQTVEPRLRDEKGRPAFDVTLYALRKDGAYASGSIWSGKSFAVHGAAGGRLEACLHLFEREA
ncbi:MAG: N(4)-(beta-N-acetylglucosaminyl)-L-asparaginase [Planctomycetes bacterium]|nr:N(4)-(beta-N-acetylglucosaminyl)-L-asparaginase [Planctomycetota bacterium]